MSKRAKELMKPKAQTQLITGLISNHGSNMLVPGTIGKSGGDFGSFTVSIWSFPTVGYSNSCRNTKVPQKQNLKSSRLHVYLKTSSWI